MQDDFTQPDLALQTLVRADLDRRADAIDPRPMLARIQRSMERAPAANLAAVDQSSAPAGHSVDLKTSRFGRPHPYRAVRWVGGLSAAAAAILIAILIGSQNTAAQASPEAIIREAQKVMQVPRDRCYLVEVHAVSQSLRQDNPASQSRMTLLWTRGDQYWMTPIHAPQPFAWGRDKSGDFWLALGPKRGLRFAPDETPPWLRVSAEVLSMRVDRLLGEVVSDFDLTREPPPAGQPATAVLIRATLKPGHTHPAISGATIEFDEQTKVVRKMVLNRTRFGKPIATVTYLLIDTETRSDSDYELEGHLDAPYEIFSHENDRQRRMILMRFFGAALGEPAPVPRPASPLAPRPFRSMQPPATRPS